VKETTHQQNTGSNATMNRKLPHVLLLPEEDHALLAADCKNIIHRMARQTCHRFVKLHSVNSK